MQRVGEEILTFVRHSQKYCCLKDTMHRALILNSLNFDEPCFERKCRMSIEDSKALKRFVQYY